MVSKNTFRISRGNKGMGLEYTDRFVNRHIGPQGEAERNRMLSVVGVNSLEELVTQTVPADIRMATDLELPTAMSEYEFAMHVRKLAADNRVFRSYLGMGYYNTITPPVIQRNIFENPGWYTQYTPYQSEISQGRLEALLNFQQMIVDFTGLDIANASLLDEATAAAEGMTLLHRSRGPEVVKRKADTFFVSRDCHVSTIEVLKTRAIPLGIALEIDDIDRFDPSNERYFGLLLQYPAEDGRLIDYSGVITAADANGVRTVLAADLLSLALLKSPGALGAHVAVGNTQRFGVPLGFGGPHAAYFATRDDFKRSMPGRLIGVSVDREGRTGLRLALQTREQHIRREKATSNICTAQALLAIMASMYAVYHGPDGIRRIATRVHRAAVILRAALAELGFTERNEHFFDTLRVNIDTGLVSRLQSAALTREINFRYLDDGSVGIALDETVSESDLIDIVTVFAESIDRGQSTDPAAIIARQVETSESITTDLSNSTGLPGNLIRTDDYLTHPVFHEHRSETEMMRYIKRLENRDLALNRAMIPLGSCTMKLNPAATMLPLTMPEFAAIHPFAPAEQCRGYERLFAELEADLAKITGLAATSLQPNSGAQGEFTGLMVIRSFHRDRGESHRDVALIPTSAHGTNPASAAMAGMQVVLVKCDDNGNIDMSDLRAQVEKHSERLSCLMVTYPSTHGVFEETIKEICDLIHQHGGQVYMDGANMNAQVGLTCPGLVGADVCHLNLHKTFSIPHGGGGPGMGPICVAEHLEPYLPGHPLAEHVGGERAIPPVAGAPRGSASILLISYGYIRLLGRYGLLNATEFAILNANYLKSRLEGAYTVLYQGKNGRIAHEMILDFREFKKAGIEVEDVAKRLVDYGFHAPTMSWPVPGTLMVEPTESEPLEELDRFCDAMLGIRSEIQDVIDGRVDATDNVLKQAPHTATEIAGDNWTHAYSRNRAVFPLSGQETYKFWPAVSRIDNVYGDRNLMCACPPVEAYAQESEPQHV
ncbi:MAG: aminomethyl-transferring glycine dehydrogenase [Leptospiraceae bacterium]|nr:aminomethyl-transferring glycine dehydrogenase [Leptospiraceae bacterium]